MMYSGRAHDFTPTILEVLRRHFGEEAEAVFQAGPLLAYLNIKTKAAHRGAKARAAFANHYALYVVIEDYIQKGYLARTADTAYAQYPGARFSDLMRRQRSLPFGAKLQNHALNARLNDEFRKFFPTLGIQPIVRDVQAQRYWIQEDLLQVTVGRIDGIPVTHNIAQAVLDIIDAYVATKKAAFEGFMETCRLMAELSVDDPQTAINFVNQQLLPQVDARIFEIVSYAILKAQYSTKGVWIGESKDTVAREMLALYKTGRTNANDGGIDFVMKPLGRFFQVTETLDFHKYFLDIDKIQRFPITFVVKSNESKDRIRADIYAQAVAIYHVEAVVKSYMDAIEEIITVTDLKTAFEEILEAGLLPNVMQEIITQSKTEFNFEDELSNKT